MVSEYLLIIGDVKKSEQRFLVDLSNFLFVMICIYLYSQLLKDKISAVVFCQQMNETAIVVGYTKIVANR